MFAYHYYLNSKVHNSQSIFLTWSIRKTTFWTLLYIILKNIWKLLTAFQLTPITVRSCDWNINTSTIKLRILLKLIYWILPECKRQRETDGHDEKFKYLILLMCLPKKCRLRIFFVGMECGWLLAGETWL